GMAHAVALAAIEEQHLARVGDRFLVAHMHDIRAAIREHELGGARSFLVAQVAMRAGTDDIAHADGGGLQQRCDRELGHGECYCSCPGTEPWNRRHFHASFRFTSTPEKRYGDCITPPLSSVTVIVPSTKTQAVSPMTAMT